MITTSRHLTGILHETHGKGPFTRRAPTLGSIISRLIASTIALALWLIPVKAAALTEGCYTYDVTDGTATITDFSTSYSGALQIPTTLGGFQVTSIGNRAFYQCGGITSLTLPSSLTKIGAWAFSECGSFTYVNIPAQVISIGEGAFDYSNLESISVDSGNPIFSSYQGVLFSKDRTTLQLFPRARSGSYTIPNGVTNVADLAFSRCFSLTSVVMPDSVVRIGNSAFYWNTSLASISFGQSVSMIGESAFIGCQHLNSIVLPSSVTTIGWQTFASCTRLENVTLSTSLTAIESSAFSGCKVLSDISIPPSVGKISQYAFKDCTNLSRLTLGGGITNIEIYAFTGCSRLASVILPDGLTSINNLVFSGCTGLTNIIVGVGVTNIANYAFSSSTKLGDIYFRGDAPVASTTIFDSCPSVRVHYLANRSGWGPVFCGRPTIPWELPVKRLYFYIMLSSVESGPEVQSPEPRSPPAPAAG